MDEDRIVADQPHPITQIFDPYKSPERAKEGPIKILPVVEKSAKAEI